MHTQKLLAVSKYLMYFLGCLGKITVSPTVSKQGTTMAKAAGQTMYVLTNPKFVSDAEDENARCSLQVLGNWTTLTLLYTVRTHLHFNN